MQEYRKDEIVYDENWQDFNSSCEYTILDNQDEKINEQTDDTKPVKEKKKKTPIALITIQLIICIVLVFLVFILKSMDSAIYKQLSLWYNEAMKNTLVSDSTFEDIDLSEYFSSTADQLLASDDEV